MMDDSSKPEQVRPDWGLCASCVHAKEIASDRGSRFVQCGLAATDPRFPRYPRTPVLACDGYRIRS
jgi:hypothetical protein